MSNYECVCICVMAGVTSPCDHHTFLEGEQSQGFTKASDCKNIYGKIHAHKSEDRSLQGLPCDVLFDKVLLLLPFPKICQLRCVCKEWNAMLFSSNFLYKIQQQSFDDGWLVMAMKSRVRGNKLGAYIPSLARWVQFPCYFSHGNTALRKCGYDASLMASAGGLICCVSKEVNQQLSCRNSVLDGMEYTLLVFNPITGSMKALPSLPSSPLVNRMALCMLYDRRNNSYKVVVNSTRYGYYRFFLEVYDSETGTWRQVCRKISEHSGIQDADLFTFHARREYNREPSWKLEGYHLESNTWSSINVPFSSRVTGKELVYKFKGRILLVQILLVEQDSSPCGTMRMLSCIQHIEGFTIWELKHINNNTNNRSTLTWENVAATPPGLLHREYKKDAVFISNGKLICMVYGNFSEPPLVYDLVLNSWYLLPSYYDDMELSGLFSFAPSSTTAF